MQNFAGIIVINIICCLVAVGLIIIGQIGLKKLEKEFGKSICDISEVERKKRLPYLICTLIGFCIPLIIWFILMVVMLNLV